MSHADCNADAHTDSDSDSDSFGFCNADADAFGFCNESAVSGASRWRQDRRCARLGSNCAEDKANLG